MPIALADPDPDPDQGAEAEASHNQGAEAEASLNQGAEAGLDQRVEVTKATAEEDLKLHQRKLRKKIKTLVLYWINRCLFIQKSRKITIT